MSIVLTDIPIIYKDLYKNRLGNYLYFYNPLSTKGVIVMSKEIAFIFNLIDGNRSINDIFKIVIKEDLTIKSNEFLNIFNNLYNSELIFLKNKKSTVRSPRDRSNLSDGKLLRVWFHITNQCNLRCIYCFVHKTTEKMNFQLALKTMARIINEAKEYGYREIVCNIAGGEPLLQFNEVLKIVKFGRKEARIRKISIKFGIITNGTLITQKIANTLKKENMFVAVSIDGLEKYQDLQRPFINGMGSFRFVERGINYLRKAKVGFNGIAVITAKNIEHLPELTKYSMNNNIPFVYYFYKDNPNSKENVEANYSQIIKYFKLALKEIYNNPPKYTLLHGLLDMVRLDHPHIYPCRAGRNYLVVRHDGKIASCPVSIDRTIGSVEDKLPLTDSIRKGSFLEPKTRSIEDIKACKDCFWRFACCGGCPLTTFQYKNSYNVNSPLCKVFKTLIPELLRIEAKRLITYDKSN